MYATDEERAALLRKAKKLADEARLTTDNVLRLASTFEREIAECARSHRPQAHGLNISLGLGDDFTIEPEPDDEDRPGAHHVRPGQTRQPCQIIELASYRRQKSPA